MNRFPALLAILLLWCPVLCSSDYQVVVKRSNKVVKGEKIREDETEIVLRSGTVEIRFKKEDLDLDKMKALNATYEPNKIQKEITLVHPQIVPSKKEEPKIPLAELSEAVKKSQTGQVKKAFTEQDLLPKDRPRAEDPKEQALMDVVYDLQIRIAKLQDQKWAAALKHEYFDSTKLVEFQEELENAKKALDQYRYTMHRQDTEVAEKIEFLNKLISSLQSDLSNLRRLNAPQAQIRELERRIDETRNELLALHRNLYK